MQHAIENDFASDMEIGQEFVSYRVPRFEMTFDGFRTPAINAHTFDSELDCDSDTGEEIQKKFLPKFCMSFSGIQTPRVKNKIKSFSTIDNSTQNAESAAPEVIRNFAVRHKVSSGTIISKKIENIIPRI